MDKQLMMTHVDDLSNIFEAHSRISQKPSLAYVFYEFCMVYGLSINSQEMNQVTERFLERYKGRFSWDLISYSCNISKDYVIEHADHISLKNLLENQATCITEEEMEQIKFLFKVKGE